MAAPAELRNAQHAPSDEIAPRECGWKHGDSGYSAGQELYRKEPRTHYEPRIPLTPTGLLMEAITLPISEFEPDASRLPPPCVWRERWESHSYIHAWAVCPFSKKIKKQGRCVRRYCTGPDCSLIRIAVATTQT